MKRIKLLYLISRLDIGGMERQLLTLVSNLDREKFDIDIVYFQGDGHLKSEFESLGCRVKKFNVTGPWDISIYPKLYSHIKRKEYDIIHTHSLKADLWGAIVGSLTRTPLIISTVHNNEERLLGNPFVRFLEKRVIGRVDNTIVIVSDGVGRFLMEKAGISKDKMKRVYYGMDASDVEIDKDKDIRQEFGIDGDAPLVGCIGRLTEQKGHIYLIQAAKNIVENFSEVKFLIVGKGELERSLKKLVRDSGLDSNFIFTGFREDVYSIIDKLDLVALPSLWEGFGLVLLEAMAMGKPVVATNVGGIPEIIQDGETGILIPPRNPDALADAIIKLLKDKGLTQRMGEAGRRRVKENFQAARMTKEIEHIYHEEDKSITDN